MIRRALIGVNVVFILLVLGGAVAEKEATLREGHRVRLALDAVDPRSLMQGDYMRLRYQVATTLAEHRPLPADALVGLALDESDVATLGVEGERPDVQVRSRVRGDLATGTPRIGPDGFFFEEGTQETYSAARFAELRVDSQGEAVLVALLDAELNVLGHALVP